MTTYRPRSTALTEYEARDAYAAPVQDPYWMLGRQLQTDGWRASAGGSAVAVELGVAVAALQLDGTVLDGPLEPRVEAEGPSAPDRLDGRTRARWGTELARLLRRAGSVPAARALAFDRPFAPPGPGAASARFAGRVPDPVAVHARLAESMGPDRSGPLPDVPGLPRTAAVRDACRVWMARMDQRLGATDPVTPTWVPERLEHRFALSTATPEAPVVLTAPDYDGAGADWHCLDREPTVAAPQPVEVTTLQVRPAPVEYRGMPLRSYWRFERGDVDLDLLDADPSASIARSLLKGFARRFGGDWHLAPLPVTAGAVQVTSLWITDTFGERIEVADVAAIDGDGAPWRFLELERTGDEAPEVTRAAAGLRVLLPPSPPPLEGPVLEDVLLARDEMANLAWVIERFTLDRDGAPVDRFRRHLQQRAAADPAYAPGRRAGSATYKLATALPDHWYPLLPGRSADGRAALLLAAVPAHARPVSDADVRGTLVPGGADTWLADEEVPGEGAQVTRRDRLLPGPDGAVVWRARTKSPGTGEASSGLQFDALL